MKTAVYCGTRNLYRAMIAAAKSLLINSDVEKIYFLIEDDSFPYYLPEIISTINVRNQTFFTPSGPNFINNWTYMVLLRAALSKIFTENTILSLDCDTFVIKDISDLWDYDITNYYLAACKEPLKSKNGLYINMGVALFNLEKMRQDHKDDEIIYNLNNTHYLFNEQDCINQLCRDKILEIPSDYNACNWTTPTQNKKIIHLAAVKNWRQHKIVHDFFIIPWSQIRGGL